MVTDPAPLTDVEAELLALASSVPDPELPMLTLAELGVVRALRLRAEEDGRPQAVEVDLTPTYTGCPAVETMASDIRRVLRESGVPEVSVRTVLSPAWSTDDITAEGRRKLHAAGIAPPRPTGGRTVGPVPVSLGPVRTAEREFPAGEPVRCPLCGSADTELLSRFSSTACKALRRCLACREPFDHFKEL
jgi:ring-1,2-phenylacetyl-CoA epoxidase subunit PaaD